MARHLTGAHSVARADLTLLTPLTIRAARIERLVRRGEATFDRLKELAGGSRSSIKRDLALLRSMGAHIVYTTWSGYVLKNADEWPGVQQLVAAELRRWA